MTANNDNRLRGTLAGDYHKKNGQISQMSSFNFTVRPPQHVKIGSHRIEFLSGCAVQELTFASSSYVQIGEINFKNYHAAWLTMQVRTRAPSSKSNGNVWKTCVKRFEMMPDPHDGKTAEDYFTISPKQMLFEPANVMSLRFILRQPSPLWQEIRIENITIYPPTMAGEMSLPGWLTQQQNPVTPTSVLNKQIHGLGLMSDVCAHMQQLWGLNQNSAPKDSPTPLGRYDVDGNYDINLLSYT